MPSLLTNIWNTCVFYFKAQRFNLGKCNFTREERLLADASNLAGVLATLQGERRELLDQLIAHLRQIFPTVLNMSVATTGAGFEILIWSTEEMQQPALSVGLDNCGTGVAQVIAILTAIMTIERAVIVIDEISSFLHPAAAKALLHIIQTNYAQHQYLISTHSFEVLTAGNPATVHIIRRSGYKSVVSRIDLDDLDQLRDVASHLGVSMTDVFAAERIIWVEGATEELCFPFIYQSTVGPMPRGLMITPVIATGDFLVKKPRRDLVLQIYESLSTSATPLVDSVRFSFDREDLSDDQMRDLNKEAKNRIAFLPRRNFECFLLDPDAIAAFICTHVPDLAGTVSSQNVSDALQKLGGHSKYKAVQQWKNDILDPNWLATVDAATLLKDLCNNVSDSRLVFRKTHHSLELLKHIMAFNRGHLAELEDYVKKLVEQRP